MRQAAGVDVDVLVVCWAAEEVFGFVDGGRGCCCV
jgi:hypothetical protein